MTYDQWMNCLSSRLQQWAQWYSQDDDLRLGYPSRSLEYRMMKEGNMARSQGQKPLSTSVKAEAIEKLIAEMAQYHPAMAAALRCHYFSRGSLREKSRQLQLSYSQYRHLLDLAHQWLIGRLSSEKNK